MQNAGRRYSPGGIAAIALSALLAAQFGQAKASTIAAQQDARIIERGEATWYGPGHAGHRTSSGARFDPSKLTAAHRNLPLGSWVRVTDDATGRSVVVLVNDREPPHGVRCIDLSQGAADRLGMRARGVASVTIYAASAADASSADAVEVAEAPPAGSQIVRHHALIARHGRPHRRRALP